MSGISQDEKYWRDYEIQRPNGTWTTVADLIQQHTERAIREAVWQPYRERAQLVAALSLFYPSHTCTDDDEPDWMVVCVHTPEGQCGWHISQRDRDLFRHLDNQPNHYDGHSTDEKYSRLAAALTDNSKGE